MLLEITTMIGSMMVMVLVIAAVTEDVAARVPVPTPIDGDVEMLVYEFVAYLLLLLLLLVHLCAYVLFTCAARYISLCVNALNELTLFCRIKLAQVSWSLNIQCDEGQPHSWLSGPWRS